MSKPVVTFGDAERLVIDYLTSIGVATSVSSSFPSETLTHPAKHVQVEAEYGDPADAPVTERVNVRVTCHAAPGQRTAVKSLASLAQGYLLAWPGGDGASGAFPLLGRSNVITDPATKNVMVWFTVRVNLKPSSVTAL